MYNKKKERLYICDLLDNPAVPYPSYYVLSSSMNNNEMLQTALIALHSFDFSYYERAKSYEDIFAMFHSGTFPIYKEKYIVGYFGNNRITSYNVCYTKLLRSIFLMKILYTIYPISIVCHDSPLWITGIL